MKKIRVGIIGYGFSGRIFHGAVLKHMEQFEVMKIVTKDPKKKVLMNEDYSDLLAVDTPEAIFDDPKIDLVAVCSLNDTHYTYAKRALEAGKHVVVEKSFTLTSDEAKTLGNLAKEKGLIISPYQNRRYDGDIRTIKKLMEDGTLGSIVDFESHFDRYKPVLDMSKPKNTEMAGAGLLYDLGAHLIDQALYLFGKPESLYADVYHQRKGPADDGFEILLYYPDLKVTLKVSSLLALDLPRFVVQGTKGTYMKYGLDIQEKDLLDGKRPKDDQWGKEPKDMWGSLRTVDSEARKLETEQGDYRDYYMGVYNAIVHGKPLEVSADDAYLTLLTTEMVRESSRIGKRINY